MPRARGGGGWRRGGAAKTVNNHIAVLKKMFNSAMDWELLERNPLARVKKLKETPYEGDFLTREESEAFLAALDERWCPFFATLLWTGMRLGDPRLECLAASPHVGRVAWHARR